MSYAPAKPFIDEIGGEYVLYEAHPAMFRNAPVTFVLAVLLIPLVAGILILVPWWLHSRSITLTVTNRRTILRRGIFSKSLSDVQNEDVRNIQVSQSFVQRLMGVGSIGLSTAGQNDIEIRVDGIPDPNAVRELINRSR